MVKFIDIIDQYDAFLFDAYGVLKNANGLIEGVKEVLQRLRSLKKPYFVITNDASKSPTLLAKFYEDAGCGDLIDPSIMISSGMLATRYLAQELPDEKVGYMGKPASRYYIEEAGCEAIPINEADENIKALVLLDDEGFEWREGMNKAMNLLSNYNILAILANTDLAYPIDVNLSALAVGSIALVLESVTKKQFIKFGKPDGGAFQLVFDLAQKKLRGLEKNKVLMVGDTLHTDIIGANQFGFDSLLTLSGNTTKKRYMQLMELSGIFPTYTCLNIRL